MRDGLPQGWAEINLPEVAELNMGQSPPSRTYNTKGNGLPFFQGKAEFGELYPTPIKYCSNPNKISEPDDILISVRAPIGPTNLCKERSCIGRGLAGIRPRDGIPSRYLLFFLRSIEDWLATQGTGSTFTAISRKDLEQLPVPIAPLNEQKRIVAKVEMLLGKVDACQKRLEHIPVLLKRFRQAVLAAACSGSLTTDWRKQNNQIGSVHDLIFKIRKQAEGKYKSKKNTYIPYPDFINLPDTWKFILSNELLSFVTSGSRGWAKYYSENGPIFLRIGNLDHDTIFLDLKYIQNVNPPKGSEGTRTKVRRNDILISITADVGMVALIPYDFGEAYISQHIALARPQKGFSEEYLAWFLASENGQKQLRTLQRGMTKVGLGLDDIRSVWVALPPLDEQNEIVRRIEVLFAFADRIEERYTKAKSHIDKLTQSILAKAFRGELVPQDPNDEPASKLLEQICQEKANKEVLGKLKRRHIK